MRGRVAFWFLTGCLLAGWCAPPVAAKNPPVKILRGPQFTELVDYQSDAPIPREPLSGEEIQPPLSQDWSNLVGDDGSLLGTPTELSMHAADGCPACGDPACDGCGFGGPYGWAVGIEATYLKPDFQQSNDAFDPPNEFGYEAAPRVWAEYLMLNGWGVRGAYWSYDAEQEGSRVFQDVATLGAQNYSDRLDLYAIDLELTRRFSIRRSEFWWSLGARNGRLRRGLNQQLSIFDLEGGGGDDATFVLQKAARDFNGTGLTTNIGLRRPLGSSRLALVSNFRNSVLWGGNDLNYKLTLGEVIPVGAGDLNLNDLTTVNHGGNNSQAMWIGEFQVGGEWSCPLGGTTDGGWAFARLMFEGQWWKVPGVAGFGGGPSTNAQMYDFIGVTAAAGIRR